MGRNIPLVQLRLTDGHFEGLKDLFDKVLDISIKVHHDKRSLNANNYLWALVEKVGSRKGKAMFKSIMTDDTETCYVCGKMGVIQKHHALHGTGRRALADAYNLVVGLCPDCHMELHDRNPQLDKWVQAKAQEAFEKYYPDKSFLKIFGKNYK